MYDNQCNFVLCYLRIIKDHFKLLELLTIEKRSATDLFKYWFSTATIIILEPLHPLPFSQPNEDF